MNQLKDVMEYWRHQQERRDIPIENVSYRSEMMKGERIDMEELEDYFEKEIEKSMRMGK